MARYRHFAAANVVHKLEQLRYASTAKLNQVLVALADTTTTWRPSHGDQGADSAPCGKDSSAHWDIAAAILSFSMSIGRRGSLEHKGSIGVQATEREP
jgi:hypothetical protein